MRKHLFLTAALTLSLAGTAAAQTADTLYVQHNVSEVVIQSQDSVIVVKAKGLPDQPSYTYTHTIHCPAGNAQEISEKYDEFFDCNLIPKKRRSSGNTSFNVELGTALGFGFVTALNVPEGMDIDMGCSHEVMLEVFEIGEIRLGRRHALSAHFGLNWRNYRMTGTKRFFKDEQNHTVITDYPENVDIDFSRIKVFSLTMPLSYTFCPARRAAVSLSAIPSFNTYASLKTRYRDSEGKKHKEVQKKIHQTPFTVDFRMMAVYRGVGAYVKYSPFNVLNTNHGPEFQGLSVGVVFLP